MYMLISHIGNEATITPNLQNEEEIFKAMIRVSCFFDCHPDDITHRVFKEADELSYKTVIQFT